MPACLDTLLIGLYVLADDLLQPRSGPGRRPRITDAELVCLAVAQVLLDLPGDRRFLAFARWRLGHLFPYLPQQSGYNKRVRALAPQIYGYCRSQHRFFWGFRLLLVCAPDGMPIGFDLVAANVPERQAAAEILERLPLAGRTVIADKGFAGQEFEQLVTDLGGRLLRPDRKDEPRRHGSLGAIRQWIESVFDTLKGQLSLERHGARTMPGLMARIAIRLLALAAALRHNQLAGTWDRSLIAYDH
jgi:hypothetical protein